MSLFVREGAVEVGRRAALVFDLDGVVADVRATYRRAYVEGLRWHLTAHLGLEVARSGTFHVAQVHALKRHPAFNAPEDVVAHFLLAALVSAERHPGAELTPALCDVGGAFERDELLAGLDASARRRVLSRLDVPRALAACREAYAGSSDLKRVYGHVPERRVKGLAHRDRLLLNPLRPPPRRPMGVYTGRARREARWLMDRFAFFSRVSDAHLACTDSGAYKPDPVPLVALHEALGGGPLVYFGDTAGDREAMARFRRERPGCLLVQVTNGEPWWPEADFVATRPGPILDLLGA